VSDIDTVVVGGLKALDPKRPIREADIPVVFMTARAQTSDIEHFKSLRTAGVITKPFDPMKLAALVRNYAAG
jgi:CheY-like chemotaxis protein